MSAKQQLHKFESQWYIDHAAHVPAQPRDCRAAMHMHRWLNTAVLGQGLLMSLHPLHFFFTFLFYTDVGSTFFVLAAYLVLPLPD